VAQPSSRRIVTEQRIDEDVKSINRYLTPKTGVGFGFAKKLSTENAGILVMGDSKIEGAGVRYTKDRSQNRLLDALRASTGMNTAGWDVGRGYIPAAYSTLWGFYDAPTLTNATLLAGTGGLGGRLVEVKSNPVGSVDFGNLDFGTSTSFEIAYAQSPFAAEFDVLVNNVVALTVNTGTPDGLTHFGKTATVPLTGTGVKNVKARWKSVNGFYLEGIVHRTSPKGIVLYDSSRSGANVDYYLTSGNSNAEMIWQSNLGVAKNVGLIVLAFGANDQAYTTPAPWEANIRALINKCAVNYPGVGIVFLMAAKLLEDAAASNHEKHAEFTRRAQKVCDEFDNVVLLEESTWFEPEVLEPQDPRGWLDDKIHYAEEAGFILGRAMARAVF
jgi:hypothetical protein